ncbi:MAG TPA: homoaconitate hydratase family protein [candidate division Zixibacteria bacterium]|nr:homoaconitate hydratase family protein [candidate division Zixibacteria bacterium]
MGQTVIEKILSKHSKDEIAPGGTIWLDLDVRSARDFGGANVLGHLEREYPGENLLADTQKTFFTLDCVSPANTIPYAENQHIIRKFAHEQGAQIYDVGAGIGTHVLIENGHVRPGMTAVGTDSHFNILGAIGAFGQGMGDRDIAFAMKTGRTWFEVPPSVRVNLAGIPERKDVTAKDVALRLLQEFGASGLLGKVVELYGDYIDRASLDERITIASLGTEMGLISIMIPTDTGLINELERWSPGDYDIIQADPDANYEAEHTIDISNLEQLVSAPFAPHNVHPRREFAGKKVESVFVGSCTGGRITDLMQLDSQVKNGIAPGLILRVVPATRRTLKLAVDSGIYETLSIAGAVISHAACAGCASGQIGMTGSGEVQVSTGNRNFKGKQGMGETFLASALLAGEVAAKGEL